MSDLSVLVNATVSRFGVLLAQLAVETGHPEIAEEVEKEFRRMAERADLELSMLQPEDGGEDRP